MLHRVMAPCSIWSASEVVVGSSDLAFEVLEVVVKRVFFKIDDSAENLNFPEILEVAQFEGLEVELKLEAVCAVKLPPVFRIIRPELPSPVEVFDASKFGSYLLHDLVIDRSLFNKHLGQIERVICH